MPGDEAVALFPCKPKTHERQIQLAANNVHWTLYECAADGLTWALGFADLQDPADVGAALQALRVSAAANLQASAARQLPLTLGGATPNPASAMLRIDGRLPNGQPVVEQVVIVAKGTRVIQATVLGAKLPDEPVDSFFSGLRLNP